MKYIRQRANGTYQFRYRESGQHKVSYTDFDLNKVVAFRDEFFGKHDVETPVTETIIGETKFGIISDTHLGSKYERLDIINELYAIFIAEGIKHVLLPGNYIEGESHFNKFDIDVYGFTNQLQYFIDYWPTGLTCHFIDGDDHEGWYKQKFGAVPGETLVGMAREQGRNDLIYHGYMEADIEVIPFKEPKIIRIVHPGGGSAKSISLKSQQLVDSYEEFEKPDVLVVGHYHKSHFLPNYGGVHILQAGACQQQTTFMRKKKIKTALGGWIMEFVGEHRLSTEFIDFKQGFWHVAK